MANIAASLATWSTTATSNQPDSTDTADIVADLQQIQATVRKYLRTIGADIASASTTDLANATGDYVSITGTTTITALGTVSAGMRFILSFAGALTLTHNATSLILPGGANIVTAAGDVAWVESLGSGNWKCLMYQSASNIYALAGANYNITSLNACTQITGLTTPLSVAQGGTGAATVPDAFNYSRTTNQASGTIILFDVLSDNVHNNYDPSTGKFTCVYPGYYIFTANVSISNNGVARFITLSMVSPGQDAAETRLVDAGTIHYFNLSSGPILMIAGDTVDTRIDVAFDANKYVTSGYFRGYQIAREG